jgi:holo-[acyl-carrier protein] synthase
MIVGVGIDIIEVDRIGEKLERGKALREKIFSPAEIAFCESKANRAQHYAARFAAKEAFLKAIGAGLSLSHELHEIEVRVDSTGKPGIGLTGTFLTLAQENKWNKIHLSLSHVQSMACAVVILEQ